MTPRPATTPARKKKAAKKAVAKSVSKSVQPGQLVPARNGGAIRHGSLPGNTPGTGRPPDEIRAKLRELGATKAVPFLSGLLDGKVSVSLLGKCDKCEHDQPLSEEWVEMIMERLKASIDQRLKASEQAMKYGLATKELVIASSEAAAFFDCVHTAVVELGGPEMAERVKARAIQLVEAKA